MLRIVAKGHVADLFQIQPFLEAVELLTGKC